MSDLLRRHESPDITILSSARRPDESAGDSVDGGVKVDIHVHTRKTADPPDLLTPPRSPRPCQEDWVSDTRD